MKLPLLTLQKDSPKGKLNKADYKRLGFNALVFVSPVLIVFFTQLSTGVEFKQAWTVALAALWILVADFLKKLQNI